jgi:hypothetical protein
VQLELVAQLVTASTTWPTQLLGYAWLLHPYQLVPQLVVLAQVLEQLTQMIGQQEQRLALVGQLVSQQVQPQACLQTDQQE